MTPKNIAQKVSVLKGILGWMTQAEADLRYPLISEGEAIELYSKTETDALIKHPVLADFQKLGADVKLLPLGVYGPLVGTPETLVDNQLMVSLFMPDANISITGVEYILDTTGAFTGDNYNGFVLCSVVGTTMTEIVRTADDANIWKATQNTIVKKAFEAPVNLVKGTKYALLGVYNYSAQTTAPKVIVFNTQNRNSFDLGGGVWYFCSNKGGFNTITSPVEYTGFSLNSNIRGFMLY